MIEIGGNKYHSRKVSQRDPYLSAIAVEDLFLISEQLDELLPKRDKESREKYRALWLELCGICLEEDVSPLALEKITPKDKRVLVDFFGLLAASATGKLQDGKENSAGSERKEGQETNSPVVTS